MLERLNKMCDKPADGPKDFMWLVTIVTIAAAAFAAAGAVLFTR